MYPKYTTAISRRVNQLVVVAGLAILLSNPVAAETSYYGGVNVIRVEYEAAGDTISGTTFEDTEWDLTALGARLGAQFHENLSAELRLGLGIGDDSSDILFTTNGVAGSMEAKLELEYYIGAYLRAGVQAGPLYPYLIAGYTNVEFEVTVEDSDFSADVDQSGFSYGVGTDLRISDGLSANLEWMKYYDKDNIEISGFQIGIAHTF